MEVERAAPSDRPRGRPVSETFMKQHRALSNWTNIVKTSKEEWGRGGKLSQQPCARSPNIPTWLSLPPSRVHTELRHAAVRTGQYRESSYNQFSSSTPHMIDGVHGTGDP
ncbi:unnamed protein product [Pleuronectes platessa]|uniref:Uncharacterized protein n=1 Tax=Pleuronectes platessa TaxID=8262 RepID=A0A9N7V618_PLEPL|nr:unnamed protein product [Pleuronectes platessa]